MKKISNLDIKKLETLYNQNNQDSLEDESFDEKNDGPTLVFDDFDQSADLEVPAYIRKQKR